MNMNVLNDKLYRRIDCAGNGKKKIRSTHKSNQITSLQHTRTEHEHERAKRQVVSTQQRGSKNDMTYLASGRGKRRKIQNEMRMNGREERKRMASGEI